MIRVRIDDYPHTRGEPQHTPAAFRSFHRALSDGTGGKRYLLGVIPGRCTPDDLLLIRNETDCVVGMHGTDHDEARLDRNGGNQFERYLTIWNVSEALEENRMALRAAVGREVQIYMPPRNVIDLRTVNVLREAGFTGFTGGPETDPTLRRDLPAVDYIHSEPPHEYGRTDEMWAHGSHEILKSAASKRDVVLSLHWTWECNLNDGYHSLLRFLRFLDGEFEHFDG